LRSCSINRNQYIRLLLPIDKCNESSTEIIATKVSILVREARRSKSARENIAYTDLLARLLLVLSLVLPNLVWAKVAVVKVSGAVVRGMKAGTGLGEPLKELAMGVGEGAEDEPEPWPFC